MKRLSAGLVATITALTLSTAVAHAQEGSSEKSSSEVSHGEAIGYAIGAATTGNMTSSIKGDKDKFTSSEIGEKAGKGNIGKAALFLSSVRNDAAKGYPVGTTAEITLGAIIAGVVLAIGAGLAHALHTGLMQLPSL
ncbi:hypothetical protein CPHO_00660 [Corynebacterium phocae]|uniref:Secreted protein n=1 Tax=Corynebacterium phocae TaxID=161895 RepID=A0A1L7D0X3_9CORY|nr:hypothetical protein [Corynebacterium phocae]APT91682.1 hypothetical protein CPHO_00660 [Corynebacterium phocae]KAA8728591.1 hypothetical protein F4V58_00215 [Corynebacterium phocae]